MMCESAADTTAMQHRATHISPCLFADRLLPLLWLLLLLVLLPLLLPPCATKAKPLPAALAAAHNRSQRSLGSFTITANSGLFSPAEEHWQHIVKPGLQLATGLDIAVCDILQHADCFCNRSRCFESHAAALIV